MECVCPSTGISQIYFLGKRTKLERHFPVILFTKNFDLKKSLTKPNLTNEKKYQKMEKIVKNEKNMKK